MTSAYILIAAILVLGGLLAVLGDRLGSKIGKKRLRLFNLRPRQTATVMTIITGVLIAASALSLLFGLSKSLRQGVFDLDRLLSERRAAIKQLERELQTAKDEKEAVEKALLKAKNDQSSAQKRLNAINKSFQASREQLRRTSSQLKTLKTDIQKLVTERQQLVRQKSQLARQKSQLAGQISQLQAKVQVRDEELVKQENQLAQQAKILVQRQTRLQQLETEQKQLQDEINNRDERIVELDKAIAQKNQSLEYRENKLQELETKIAFLQREVEILTQYYENYQELRQKEIAIVKGQVLSFGAFRIVDSKAIVSVIDELLREANLTAIGATQPGNTDPNQRVVKITKAQVEQLIQQLQDGREYVVRILSAGNYVMGEKEVRVFADIALNQKIFDAKEEIATVSIDPQSMGEEELQQRLDLLLSSAQFRARRSGVLGTIQVEDGRLTTLINFIEKVQRSDESLDAIKAIAADTTYTAGPMKLRLVVVRNGEIIFST